ncbi:hypothetical protein ACFE04_021098 [Oxalis oulophora]
MTIENETHATGSGGTLCLGRGTLWTGSNISLTWAKDHNTGAALRPQLYTLGSGFSLSQPEPDHFQASATSCPPNPNFPKSSKHPKNSGLLSSPLAETIYTIHHHELICETSKPHDLL